MQDAAVAVVVDFDGGVDAAGGEELDFGAIGFGGGDLDVLARGDVGGGVDIEGFLAGEAEGLGGVAFLEAEREDAHADEVGAVDAFEGDGDDGFDTEEEGAFGGPVAAGAHAVVFAGEDDEGDVGGFVAEAGVVDGFDGGIREIDGPATFGAGSEFVLDADVGEGAAGHDAVVAAAGAVAVEHGGGDVFGDKIFAGGAVFFDGAGGGDVVGCDGVAEEGEAAGFAWMGDGIFAGFERMGKIGEIGGILANVGTVFVPLLKVWRGAGHLDGLPLGGLSSKTFLYWAMNWSRVRRRGRRFPRSRGRRARCL